MAAVSVETDSIPTFRIDLARPPEHRYTHVAAAFAPRLQSLSGIFDELLAGLLGYAPLVRFARLAARLLLRRVYDDEQTREIEGFARVAGVDRHLIVALNVLLDVLMGCSAGCVRVRSGRRGEEGRLMHFRTLDWGADPLRELLVVIEYVDSSRDHDQVIASSVTYAGFVGILTGVR